MGDLNDHKTLWKYPKPSPQAFASTGALSKKHRLEYERNSMPILDTPQTPSKTEKSKFIVPVSLSPFPYSPHLIGNKSRLSTSHPPSSTPMRSRLGINPNSDTEFEILPNNNSPTKPFIEKRSSSPIAVRNSTNDRLDFFMESGSLVDDIETPTKFEMETDDFEDCLNISPPFLKPLPWKSPKPNFLDPDYLSSYSQGHREVFFPEVFNSPPPSNASDDAKIYADYFSTNFDRLECLGEGSFSLVWKVRTRSSPENKDIIFACKRSKEPFAGMADRDRRLREVENMWHVVGHPNCLQIVNAWEQEGYLYILSEFCENGSLKNVIEYMAESGTRFTEYQVWNILHQLALGLMHIHRADIVHLDIKPANILIDQNGVLKIADYGLSTRLGQTHDPDAEGDKYYMAPEILEGIFDKPADIFSLGLLILEIAADVDLPAQGNSWQNLRHGDYSELSFDDISDTLNHLIKEMTDPLPQNRPIISDVLRRVDSFMKRAFDSP